MSPDRIYRLAGRALLVGAAVGVIMLAYVDVVFQGGRPVYMSNPLWIWSCLVALTGGMLALLAFTAVYVRQAEQTGWLGLWGWVLTSAAGMLFTVALTSIYMLAVPLLSADDQRIFDPVSGLQSHPAVPLVLFFLVATLLFTCGTVMLGIATNRAGVFPAWTGWALIGCGLISVVTTAIRLAQPAVVPIAADVHLLLFLATQCALGYYLGRRETAQAPHPAPATR